MKRKARERLEYAESIVLARQRSYQTVDIVTGLDKPYLIAVPVEVEEFMGSGHVRIDLPAMGFKLTKATP